MIKIIDTIINQLQVINLDLSTIVSKLIKRARKKIKRELYRLPPIKAKAEKAYHQRIENHAPYLPKLNKTDRIIVQTLKETGTCIISIQQLQLSLTEAMLHQSNKLVEKLKILPVNNQSFLGFNKSQLMEYPEIFLWGIEERLLDIIENYLGLPVMYQGLAMRRDIADGKYVGVREWHIDWEDRTAIKIIVYFNDVGIDGGPYEYLTKKVTNKAIERLNYKGVGFLTDETMEKAIPKFYWQACLGKAGTVIITDTCRVFHRAKPALQTERFSITFCYTSDKPEVVWNNQKFSAEYWQKLTKGLSQRQKLSIANNS